MLKKMSSGKECLHSNHIRPFHIREKTHVRKKTPFPDIAQTFRPEQSMASCAERSESGGIEFDALYRKKVRVCSCVKTFTRIIPDSPSPQGCSPIP
jgi:hypothetical protein